MASATSSAFSLPGGTPSGSSPLKGCIVWAAIGVVVGGRTGYEDAELRRRRLHLWLWPVTQFFRQPDRQLGNLLGTNWLTMGMILSSPMVPAEAG
jgi:prolipoprotein diacylglyceryltransferase